MKTKGPLKFKVTGSGRVDPRHVLPVVTNFFSYGLNFSLGYFVRVQVMPAVPSSSVSERQERASLRSRALQNTPCLTSEDTGSGNLMSSANGQGEGRRQKQI